MRRCGCLLALLTACPGGQEGSAVHSSAEVGGEASSFPPTGGEPTPPPPLEPGALRFAVIGDYGLDGAPMARVAALVAGWDPSFIVTVGDNNYYDGLASTIDANIGKHYHRFIAPYLGAHGPGAAENRFFPCPGNHDWKSGTLQPYLDYFTLPGNERYYRLRRGPVELFLLDSDEHEPDGLDPDGVQGQWLEAALADSTARFRVVLMHHAPHSSGMHLSTEQMRWPYAAWGADLVLAGHDHDYERLVVDGMYYVVTGTGGAALRSFSAETPGSQRGHSDSFGALRIDVDETWMTVDFIATSGARIDRLQLAADPPTQWQPRITTGSNWRYFESDPGPGWAAPTFADGAWASGAAPLGFGLGGEATKLAGGTATIRPLTTYFRRRFTADPGDRDAPLRLRLAVDDGAIVYLNGVEVYRINLPERPVHDATTAAVAVRDWFPLRLAETMLPGDALVPGENTLAVEVHQQFAFSSDLRFDLELAAGAP